MRMKRDERLSLVVVALVGLLPAIGWFAISALGDMVGAGARTCAQGETASQFLSESTPCVYNPRSDAFQLPLHSATVLLLFVSFVSIMVYLWKTRHGRR
jgi:hypothetical protein